MPFTARLALWGCLAVAAVATVPASAAPVTYTARGAFDAAVGALPAGSVQPTVINFDDKAAGTTYPSGTGLSGVTFGYSIGSFQLAVRQGTPTLGGASGLNTLALKGAAVASFTTGDVVQLTFAQPTRAFGFHVVVGQNFNFFHQDVNLTFAGTTYSLSGDETPAAVGTNGAHAIWVGIVDPAAAYTAATIRFGPVGSGPGGSFELDDLSFATVVPEPASAMAAGTAALSLLCMRRRRR